MQAVEGILGSADGGRKCKGASGGKSVKVPAAIGHVELQTVEG